MGRDLKYGRVTTERGTIGDDEPVLVFRGRDAMLVGVLRDYKHRCTAAGAGHDHLDAIDRAIGYVTEWQSHNETQVPTTKPIEEA